jgi:hypothetical protein
MHCCILLDFLCELYYDAWIHEHNHLRLVVGMFVCVCTTAFDTKTHIAHTFRLCVPCHAHKSSEYFATPIGVYNGSTLCSV